MRLVVECVRQRVAVIPTMFIPTHIGMWIGGFLATIVKSTSLSNPSPCKKCGCSIYWAASLIIVRLPKTAETISWKDITLSHTFQVLAMTSGKRLDESGNYKNMEVKCEDNT
jgi:hypothetical protein